MSCNRIRKTPVKIIAVIIRNDEVHGAIKIIEDVSINTGFITSESSSIKRWREIRQHFCFDQILRYIIYKRCTGTFSRHSGSSLDSL